MTAVPHYKTRNLPKIDSASSNELLDESAIGSTWRIKKFLAFDGASASLNAFYSFFEKKFQWLQEKIPFNGLRGHFLSLSSGLGLNASSMEAFDVDLHLLSLHLLHCPVTTRCLFSTSLALTSSYSALNLFGFWQILSGFPRWARIVLCRWGPFLQHGRGRARSTAWRVMMTSSKKLARPTMSASPATWAPSWCLSQTWRRWSSSASSRPPVLAAGASVWFWAHILSIADLKRDLDLSSIIQVHR